MGELHLVDLLPSLSFPDDVAVEPLGPHRMAVTLRSWKVTHRPTGRPDWRDGRRFEVGGSNAWSEETIGAASSGADDDTLARLMVDDVAVELVAAMLHEFVEFAGINGRRLYGAHGPRGDSAWGTSRMADLILRRTALHAAAPTQGGE